jgi:transcriptional regulator with XRE-family HTH domain
MRVRKEGRGGIVSGMSRNSEPKRERNEELIKAFATELSTRRKKAGLSQDKFALAASVDRSFIAKLELAKFQPSLSVLYDLAKALDNELPDFIQGVFSRYKKTQNHCNKVALLKCTANKEPPLKHDGSST